MKELNDFTRASEDPHQYAKALKAQGRNILGYFCSYTPEEVIHAAGIHPLRLFGSRGDTSLADKHLQSYCCSVARGALADVLGGTLDYLDGAVFPHTCDTIQRLSDIWRLNTHFKFFADVVLPVKLNTESALKYLEDVLRKFRRDLEKGFGIQISDASLKASIHTYNAIRTLLKRLSEIRSKDPGILSARDLNAMMKGAMVIDRNQLVEKLTHVVQKLEGQHSVGLNTKKRIMLAGSICDHPDIYNQLEQAGAEVVWEDLCTGSRYFEGMISEDGEPIAAIARRYFERAICPAKHVSITARGENLVKQAREHGIQGVVFLLLKFCDPHSFDYPYLKEFLDRENIPSMLLEIENQLPPEGQLLTRFETFVQML
jgi:bzd-type benzoyl-CoA reductase N subunit